MVRRIEGFHQYAVRRDRTQELLGSTRCGWGRGAAESFQNKLIRTRFKKNEIAAFGSTTAR